MSKTVVTFTIVDNRFTLEGDDGLSPLVFARIAHMALATGCAEAAALDLSPTGEAGVAVMEACVSWLEPIVLPSGRDRIGRA